MSSGNLGNAPALVTIHSYPDDSFSGNASIRRGLKSEDSSNGDSAWWAMTDEEREIANAKRSGHRAIQTLTRKVRHGNLRRLLTFTNGGRGQGWESLRSSVLDVCEWFKAEGDLLGDTGFICVAERGKDGGRIHVHAAIRSGYRLDYSAIIASWTAFLTAKGYESSTGSHRWHAGDELGRGRTGFSSARTCADYLSKYLAKGFKSDARAKFEKRFRSSGCYLPEPKRLCGGVMDDVPGLLAEMFEGRSIHTRWFEGGDGSYGGYTFEVGPAG